MGLPMKRDQAANGACSRDAPALRVLLVDRYTMAWRVVIAGGGFGGLYAARRLERVLPPQSAHITLVSESNFLLYTPLLPGAAAGTLEPRHVVVPLREELERTDIASDGSPAPNQNARSFTSRPSTGATRGLATTT